MEGSSAADFKKNDGLEAIRTPDLRRVKAEDSELEMAFSRLSGCFLKRVILILTEFNYYLLIKI